MAGYKANSDNIAGVEGNKLLKNPKIKNYIDEQLRKLTEKAGVTQEKIINELAIIGFSKVTDYLKVDDYEITVGYEKDEEGILDYTRPKKKIIRGVEIYKTDEIPDDKLAALSEIRETKDGISVKLHNKITALELLGKNLKMWSDKAEPDINKPIEIVIKRKGEGK